MDIFVYFHFFDLVQLTPNYSDLGPILLRFLHVRTNLQSCPKVPKIASTKEILGYNFRTLHTQVTQWGSKRTSEQQTFTCQLFNYSSRVFMFTVQPVSENIQKSSKVPFSSCAPSCRKMNDDLQVCLIVFDHANASTSMCQLVKIHNRNWHFMHIILRPHQL